MSEQRPIRVLIVEDNLSDAELVGRALKDAPRLFELAYCDRVSSALPCIEASAPDVVLLDLGLPDAQDIEAVATLHAQHPDLPLVALTGREPGEGIGERAIEAGAQDYLPKSEIGSVLLCRVLRYAIRRSRITAEERTREVEERALLADVRSSLDRYEAGMARRLATQEGMLRQGTAAREGGPHAGAARSA